MDLSFIEGFETIWTVVRAVVLNYLLRSLKILSTILYVSAVISWNVSLKVFGNVLLPGFLTIRTVVIFILRIVSLFLWILADPAILLVQSVYWYFIRAPARFILMVGITLYPLYVLLSWAVFLGIIVGFSLNSVFTFIDSFATPSSNSTVTEAMSKMQNEKALEYPYKDRKIMLGDLASRIPSKDSEKLDEERQPIALEKTKSLDSISHSSSSSRKSSTELKIPPVETRIVAEIPVPSSVKRRRHRPNKSMGSIKNS
ncbi:hypothetical protein POMI540_4460 [Schizosaccharomyces pombe]